MKHPCSCRVTSKEWSSTVCFPLHLVRRELTQQDHTVTTPRWPAPGTTGTKPGPPAQPAPILQSRSHTPGCPCQAPCAQGRGHEPRMLLQPGWLTSSSLPQAPHPPGAWGCSCRKPPLLSVRFINRSSAHCRSLGCIATWVLYCQPAGSLEQKYPPDHQKYKPHTFCSLYGLSWLIPRECQCYD